eukprot:jgi/Ulvmu1/9814/UM056_0055.1
MLIVYRHEAFQRSRVVCLFPCSCGTMDASTSQARWELENNVENTDEYLKWDEDAASAVVRQAPWKTDPKHYKKVKISALALLKMVMHARSGGRLEVMGMMQGKTVGDTFIVVDSFALPVEGTETRVNAAEGAYEFLATYPETAKAVGRHENIVGWYHSHPGYGCWLSGIDCQTQMINQKHQEPWLAIVVDPHRTMSAGKVEIGAFRTYPEGYTPPNSAPSEYQPIPLNKIEDFGVHADMYYSLEISIFKTSLDSQIIKLLWNKYWANTLSASPLLANEAFIGGQLEDMSMKLDKAACWLDGQRFTGKSKDAENDLTKVVKDCSKLAEEQLKGLTNQVVKQVLFNRQRDDSS